MCTLILEFHPGTARPITLLANRDERLNRPAQGWTVRPSVTGRSMLAPRDLTAGGSWVGINNAGVVVALTNHNTGKPPEDTRASRGALVEEMLGHPSAAAARAAVKDRNAQTYNPFHLVVADQHTGWLWHSTLEHQLLEPLERGVHIIVESDAHGDSKRGALIRQKYASTATAQDARALLSIHETIPFHGTCLHMGEIYGTRSSARLVLEGSASTLHVADGPPCVTPWTDRTADLRALLG